MHHQASDSVKGVKVVKAKESQELAFNLEIEGKDLLSFRVFPSSLYESIWDVYSILLNAKRSDHLPKIITPFH
jgi:hypothetical protein